MCNYQSYTSHKHHYSAETDWLTGCSDPTARSRTSALLRLLSFVLFIYVSRLVLPHSTLLQASSCFYFCCCFTSWSSWCFLSPLWYALSLPFASHFNSLKENARHPHQLSRLTGECYYCYVDRQNLMENHHFLMNIHDLKSDKKTKKKIIFP